MNRALLTDLIRQLQAGLMQPEELTEPEMREVLSLRQENPSAVPTEVATRLRQRVRFAQEKDPQWLAGPT